MNAKQRNGMAKSIFLNFKRLVLGGGKMIAARLSCAAIQAYAIEFTATGVVQKIFALDKIVYGVDKSHILIAGMNYPAASCGVLNAQPEKPLVASHGELNPTRLSVAGTCPTNDGLIALALRDDDGGRRQLSVALAAKLTNRPVVIRVEDLNKTDLDNAT